MPKGKRSPESPPHTSDDEFVWRRKHKKRARVNAAEKKAAEEKAAEVKAAEEKAAEAEERRQLKTALPAEFGSFDQIYGIYGQRWLAGNLTPCLPSEIATCSCMEPYMNAQPNLGLGEEKTREKVAEE